MEIEDAKLRKYLLGSLSTGETEQLDLQLISDSSVEEKLYRAENDLMEDYLDEALTSADRELFKKNFLVSSERKIQLRQLALLRRYARREIAKESSGKLCEESTEGIWVNLRRYFSLPKLQFAVGVLALIVVVALIGVVLYNKSYEPTLLEKEYAQINQSDLSNLDNFKNLSNVSLFAGTFRNSDGAKKFSESGFSEKVLIRLALQENADSGDAFTIELIKDQKIVFTQNKIRIYSNPNGRELRLLFPAVLLKKGDYQIKAEKDGAAKSVSFYNFSVQ